MTLFKKVKVSGELGQLHSALMHDGHYFFLCQILRVKASIKFR